MKYVAISFTLKNQNFQSIATVLRGIKANFGESVVLIHGFMTRNAVVEKGFPTEVVDTLDEIFPNQLNFYFEGKPDREAMCEAAVALSAPVYVVGDEVDGVKEEADIYRNLGAHVMNYSLVEQ